MAKKEEKKKRKERNIKIFKILLIKRNFIPLPNAFLFFNYFRNRNFGLLPNVFKCSESVSEHRIKKNHFQPESVFGYKIVAMCSLSVHYANTVNHLLSLNYEKKMQKRNTF